MRCRTDGSRILCWTSSSSCGARMRSTASRLWKPRVSSSDCSCRCRPTSRSGTRSRSNGPAPDRFGFYSELLLAVQMAHRNGVLGEIDATRFVAAAQQIALARGCGLRSRPTCHVWSPRPRSSTSVCARFDVQVTLTVEATQGAVDGRRGAGGGEGPRASAPVWGTAAGSCARRPVSRCWSLTTASLPTRTPGGFDRRSRWCDRRGNLWRDSLPSPTSWRPV